MRNLFDPTTWASSIPVQAGKPRRFADGQLGTPGNPLPAGVTAPANGGWTGNAAGPYNPAAWGGNTGANSDPNNPNVGLGPGTGFSQPTQNVNGTPMTGANGSNPGGESYYNGQSNPGQGVWGDEPLPYTPGSQAYNYGGAAGGAEQQQSAYAQMGQNALNQQAAQVSNQYAGADRSQNQGVQAGEQGLGAFYQQQMNMGVNSPQNLGTAELNKATAQGIAAQQAEAASAQGSLSGALANRNAQQQGVASQNQANQNAAINTIQQQNQAAQMQAQLLGQQGQQGLQQSGQDLQNAQYAAGLQQQQNALGQQTALGYGALQNQVGIAQLGAQEQQQQANLQAAGMGQQQTQFNTQQNNQVLGTILGTGGALLGAGAGYLKGGGGGSSSSGGGGSYGYSHYSDADFEEPGNPHNGWTLREEQGGPDHDPFMLAFDRERNIPMKVAMQPLSPAELRQVNAPHGAGPLHAPDRMRTNVQDIHMSDWDLAPAFGPAPNGKKMIPTSGPMSMSTLGPRGFADADMSGFSETEKHISAADLDLKGGKYGDPPPAALAAPTQAELLAAQQAQQQSDPLNATYSNFNGGIPTPAAGPSRPSNIDPAQWAAMSPKDQARVKAASDAAAFANHDQGYQPGLVQSLGAGIAPGGQHQGSLDETGGGLRHVDGPGPDVPPSTKPVNPTSLVKPPGQNAGSTGGGGTVPTSGGGAGGPIRTGWQDLADPTDRAAMDRGAAGQLAAIQDQRDADLHQAENSGVAAGLRGQTRLDQAIETKRLEDDRKRVEEEWQTRREKASKELQKAGEDYGFKPSTAQALTMTLAAALGAAGSGLNRGMQNYAMTAINDTISRDLAEQAKHIEAKKGRVADLDGALASAYRQTGDMRQSLLLAHSNALQTLDDQAAEHAAAANQEQVTAKYNALHGQIEANLAENRAKYFKLVQTGGGSGTAAADQKKEIDAFHDITKAAVLKGEAPPSWNDFHQTWQHGGGAGAPLGSGLSKNKPNAAGVALGEALKSPAEGEGWLGRHTPEALQSPESQRNTAVLANQVRTYAAAQHIKLSGSNEEVINAIVGPPTPENVKAFHKRAGNLVPGISSAQMGPETGGSSDDDKK